MDDMRQNSLEDLINQDRELKQAKGERPQADVSALQAEIQAIRESSDFFWAKVHAQFPSMRRKLDEFNQKIAFLKQEIRIKKQEDILKRQNQINQQRNTVLASIREIVREANGDVHSFEAKPSFGSMHRMRREK